jgi:LmbE family N-acetylglucosaminyl deacetylase
MTKAERDQQRREEARKAVRAYLAQRTGVAMGIPAITRGLKYEGDYDEEEVSAALQNLKVRNHVVETPDGDGATLYYQIAAEGITAYERGL